MQPWYLSHRVDLHNQLKLLALGEEGNGTPAELHLSSAVESVEAEEGIVILENGEKHTFDLIVAADGVRVGRTRFPNRFHIKLTVGSHESENKYSIQQSQKSTGEAAYRFIIDMSEVANDLGCLPIAAKDGKCRIAIISEKRVVMYPCRD